MNIQLPITDRARFRNEEFRQNYLVKACNVSSFCVVLLLGMFMRQPRNPEGNQCWVKGKYLIKSQPCAGTLSQASEDSLFRALLFLLPISNSGLYTYCYPFLVSRFFFVLLYTATMAFYQCLWHTIFVRKCGALGCYKYRTSLQKS